jgi:taurine dioxygenase
LDLSRALDNAALKAMLHLLDTRGLIIVRKQRLGAPSLQAFSRSLGDLSEHPLDKFSVPGFPELMVHSNIVENGEPIGRADTGERWRMDGAHMKTPYRATVIYALEIPAKDGISLGDTWFANTSAAYDALDPALRQQLQGMRAIHMHGAGRKKRSTPYFPDSGLTQTFRRGVEHPVVRTHPQTGRKCLYVNPVTTSHIRGMNEQDSSALLDQLYQHMARPEFVYRLQWQAGDLVMWDNCMTQNRTANDYELPLRRLVYLVQVKGVSAP